MGRRVKTVFFSPAYTTLGFPHRVARVVDPFEPLSQAPLDALFSKTALLLALVSAKRTCELTALSVSPSCLLLNEDSSFKLLRPNPA